MATEQATWRGESKSLQRRRPLSPRQHVVLWVVGVVIASLLPLLAILLHGLTNPRPPGLVELLGNGDLVLIGVVVTIAGLMELVRSWSRIREDRNFVVALVTLCTALLITCEALYYASIGGTVMDGKPVGEPVLNAWLSLAFFIFSTVCGAVCVGIAAGDD